MRAPAMSGGRNRLACPKLGRNCIIRPFPQRSRARNHHETLLSRRMQRPPVRARITKRRRRLFTLTGRLAGPADSLLVEAIGDRARPVQGPWNIPLDLNRALMEEGRAVEGDQAPA